MGKSDRSGHESSHKIAGFILDGQINLAASLSDKHELFEEVFSCEVRVFSADYSVKPLKRTGWWDVQIVMDHYRFAGLIAFSKEFTYG